MSISTNYGPPADIDEGVEVIRAAFEKGVTFFDTAEGTAPTQTKSWLILTWGRDLDVPRKDTFRN
jgi:aryl-alcohol dehydrogenase-like predicted oxidoreductase